MAVTSSTDICNLALDLLSAGVVVDIDNPTDPTEEFLNRWYDQIRRKVLRSHTWNFAIAREVLAASATAPAFGYASAFPVPADFVRLVYISTDLSTDRETILPASAYQFEDGSVLVTNTYGDTDALNMVYVYDHTTVSTMDPLFIDLMAHELALVIAYKTTENTTNVQRLAELVRQKYVQAKAVDGQEKPPVRVQRSKSISARRMGSARDSHRIIF